MTNRFGNRRSVLLFVLVVGLVGLAHGNGKQAPHFIRVIANLPGALLRWRSTAAINAVVERSSDLIGWTPIRTNAAAADSTNTTVDADAPGPAAMYRIRVSP